MSKNKSDKTSEVNIQSQNVDTTAGAISSIDDTRPFEQKNMPKGAFKKNFGSK